MALVIVYFDSMGYTDGVEYGNVVTVDGDPIEYSISAEQFALDYPENIWVNLLADQVQEWEDMLLVWAENDERGR